MLASRHTALLVGLVLLGTAGYRRATPTPSAEQGSPPATSSPGAESSAPSTGAPSASSSDPAEPPAGTVSATYPAPDVAGSTVRLQALPIVVSGSLATLTVLWTPTYPARPADEDVDIYTMNGKNPVYVSLVDAVGLKRYNVVKDSNGRDLSTEEVGTGAVSGSTVSSRYVFSAPPAGLTTMDAYVGGFPPLPEVPVQR